MKKRKFTILAIVFVLACSVFAVQAQTESFQLQESIPVKIRKPHYWQ